MEEVNPLHDFRSEFSAPVTGITPSTQVGRLSGSHFDIGFQLAQLPGRNGKAKRLARTVWLNNVCNLTHKRGCKAAVGKKGLGDVP